MPVLRQQSQRHEHTKRQSSEPKADSFLRTPSRYLSLHRMPPPYSYSSSHDIHIKRALSVLSYTAEDLGHGQHDAIDPRAQHSFARHLFRTVDRINVLLNNAWLPSDKQQDYLAMACFIACHAMQDLIDTKHFRNAIVQLARLEREHPDLDQAVINMETFLQTERRLLQACRVPESVATGVLSACRQVLTMIEDEELPPKHGIYAAISTLAHETCQLADIQKSKVLKKRKRERVRRGLADAARALSGAGLVVVDATATMSSPDLAPVAVLSGVTGGVFIKVAVDK